MARIRTIKPEFWTDEKIVLLPFEVRLLFIGMWNFADDHGMIENKPDQIRLRVLPGDPQVNIDMAIEILIAAGLVDYVLLEDGSSALQISHWKQHQKVDKPAPTKFTRESSRKVAIPPAVRRAIAIKYKCQPGGEKDIECYFCGEPGQIYWFKLYSGKPSAWVVFPNMEIDHLIPESEGGENTAENLVLSCPHCNRSRNNKNHIDWAVNKFVASPRESSVILATEWKGKEGNGREEERKKHLSEYSDDFLTFWDSYPNKTGKGEASKSWKIVSPPLETVLNAIKWQTNCQKWRDGYVPNPSTYLNQRRWEDEPPAPSLKGVLTDRGIEMMQGMENILARRQANGRTGETQNIIQIGSGV